MKLLLVFLFCTIGCTQDRNQHNVVRDMELPDSRSLNCSVISSETGSCPPGLFCNVASGICECGVYQDSTIICDGTRVFVSGYTCVTLDGEESTDLLAGNCFRPLKSTTSHAHVGFEQLSESIYQLDAMMCRPLNRTGTLCGSCLPDHYPLAYSYNMACTRCSNARWNWVKYIMAAYLPLTLFYFLILFFKINTTSSQLSPVVYYCQMFLMPYLLRLLFSSLLNNFNTSFVIAVKTIISLYGIWNLDFFRPFYSGFCLEMGILPTLALDYAIAVYPFLLMIISYLLIVLYDRNYRVITVMWSPFRTILSLFRRNWDIKTSVIDAFTTLFYLSNFKVLSVSTDFLMFSQAYTIHQNTSNVVSLRLFYAGDTLYFSHDHYPYALLSLAAFGIFVFIPTAVLALYPFQIFQRCLNRLPARWVVILNTIVDSFQGCYKDGTEPGTRDCRWFAAVFFLARCLHVTLYDASRNNIANASQLDHSCLSAPHNHNCSLSAIQTITGALQHHSHYIPSISNILNISENGLFLSLYVAPNLTGTFLVLVCLFLTLMPLLYAIGIMAYWIYGKRKFELNILRQIRTWRNGYASLPQLDDHYSYPDRIENSGDYHRENLANFVEQLPGGTSKEQN